jgi:hypothetical protein
MPGIALYKGKILEMPFPNIKARKSNITIIQKESHSRSDNTKFRKLFLLRWAKPAA